jgi:hypothetical protein
MKKLMTFLAIVVCPIAPMSVVAQGLINWNNTSTTLISVNGSPMPVPVSPETTFYFALFVAPLGTPAPAQGVPSITDPNWQIVVAYAENAAPAGVLRMPPYCPPGPAIVSGKAAGTSVNFIVRGWQKPGGLHWDPYSGYVVYYGVSALGTAVLGGGPFPIPEAFGTGAGQIGGFDISRWCMSCDPPYFLAYPSNVVVALGGSVTFRTQASNPWPPQTGHPSDWLGYQWRKQGSYISGATSPELTLSNVTLSDAGNYDVVASNIYGSTPSTVARLTVFAPVIAGTLGSPAYTANNQFQFTVTGTAGSNYVVQVATNLSTPTVWISLSTNASPFTFVDYNAQNFPQRFYRAQAR